jgi:hypothetical protein
MVETNDPSTPFWKLRTLLIIIVSLSLTGCPAGYAAFNHKELSITEPFPSLAQIKISFLKPEPKSSSYWESVYSEELYFSLSRTLRSRYRIFDINSNQQEKFIITAEHSPKSLKGDIETGVWSFIHRYSLAAVPMIWNEKHSLIFTVTAPSNKKRTFIYDYTIRYYSWLPFLLFDPGFILTTEGWMDSYQDRRIRLYDEITALFMQEAAPFFLSQQKELSISANSEGASHE